MLGRDGTYVHADLQVKEDMESIMVLREPLCDLVRRLFRRRGHSDDGAVLRVDAEEVDIRSREADAVAGAHIC